MKIHVGIWRKLSVNQKLKLIKAATSLNTSGLGKNKEDFNTHSRKVS